MLAREKTCLVNVPNGLTAYIQVLDVGVNKPFKDRIRQQSERHLDANLEPYTTGKMWN